jgi:murein DD-endopeptidase MepM/ murein hydrolase activator NlpD
VKLVSNTLLTALLLLALQSLSSCSMIRTQLDASCVSQFAEKYPEPQDSPFVLPWRIGETYTLTQGNCTLESHNLANNNHMSFDFKMPIGTSVVAIADGKVIFVTEHFKDNIDMAYQQANLIAIEHKGGIISWYAHLQFQGVKVKVDDEVLQGDVIGFSGNSGDSAYPHLHFYAQQLTQTCFDANKGTANLALCPMMPISFNNASPNDTVLVEFEDYRALAYQR